MQLNDNQQRLTVNTDNNMSIESRKICTEFAIAYANKQFENEAPKKQKNNPYITVSGDFTYYIKCENKEIFLCTFDLKFEFKIDGKLKITKTGNCSEKCRYYTDNFLKKNRCPFCDNQIGQINLKKHINASANRKL
jgi:hypothetical protein